MSSPTYAELVAGFRPVFGNANHIAASRLIARRDKLQASLKRYEARKATPPRTLIKEMDSTENKVISLLKPKAAAVTYKGPEDSL